MGTEQPWPTPTMLIHDKTWLANLIFVFHILYKIFFWQKSYIILINYSTLKLAIWYFTTCKDVWVVVYCLQCVLF
jgi:hypothetical protein